MADKKVSDLPSLNGADVDPADLLYIVDSSAGAAGSKKITVGQYQLAPVSGGTANTVVYLNGSKVESSSSALTFDGTNLGIGTSSPSSALYVKRTSGNAEFNIDYNGTNVGRIVAASNGNLYFGTSVGAGSVLIGNTANADALTLDSSGNLGLGVTPSAWGTFKAFDLFSSLGASLASTGGSMQLGMNFYYDGSNYKYKDTGFATRYEQLGGGAGTTSHAWFNAPSGTAGNAITFTQAMTLDASGNLLVGTTSTTMGQTGVTIIPALGGQVGYIQIGHANGTSSGNGYADFFYNAVSIGSITQNGTTAVAFNTTSDRRLKDNIVPAPSASDVIDAIQIVSHDWKSAPDEHVTYGVIAQDLHAVAPQAVLQGDEGDAVEKPWGVDYSKLVPMLIKEIQTLRARVAALEAK